VSLRRHLHQPRRPLRGEVQLLRAAPRRRPRAGLRRGLPDAGHPRGRSERPALQGLARGRARGGERAPPGEGHPAEALLQGGAPGDARPARRPAAPGRLLHVERGRLDRAPRPGERPPRRRQLLCRGDAGVRRAPPRALGLARVALHLDEGYRCGCIPRARRARRARGRPRGGLPLPLDGAAPRARLPCHDRRRPHRRPLPPGAVLDDLRAPPVAELARPRRLRNRRLRRRARAAPRGLAPRLGAPPPAPLGRDPARPLHRRLHRKHGRATSGKARFSRLTSRSRPRSRVLPPSCPGPPRRATPRRARSAGSPRARARSTCSSSSARFRSPTRPRMRASPRAR
jgi:hypothetical protein